jgi:hypothetical protein
MSATPKTDKVDVETVSNSELLRRIEAIEKLLIEHILPAYNASQKTPNSF